MRKSSADPKVKKSMVRNYERKVNSQSKQPYHVIAGCSTTIEPTFHKEIDQNLSKPTTCSSEVLATYLSKAKKDIHSLSDQEKSIDNVKLGTKITKKLNFHFNDTIYKNLVELNADVANSKNRKDKKVCKTVLSVKKDVEPNIDDFCNTEKEEDLCPDIPIVKPKLKRITEYESEKLHNLVTTFEKL